MIKIENLSIIFDDVYLFKDFSYTINEAEITCICGGSGSGKTTLLKALMGFIPVHDGNIIVNGIKLNGKNSELVRKNIGWIPQELALPINKVSDMVKLPFELKANKNMGFDEHELMENFASLGLEEGLYNKRVNEISGGQRQRIMLAVTAMLKKKIMILDEPTSALDSDSCNRVIDFLRRIKNEGTTIVIVSHDKILAQSCDNTIILKN